MTVVTSTARGGGAGGCFLAQERQTSPERRSIAIWIVESPTRRQEFRASDTGIEASKNRCPTYHSPGRADSTPAASRCQRPASASAPVEILRAVDVRDRDDDDLERHARR